MLLIKHTLLYTMEEGAIPEEGDILVEDGKITAIGRDLDANGATIIDGEGLIATPGLIDAHIHTGGFDFADISERTDPVTPHMDAAYAIDIHAEDFQELHTKGVTAACFIPAAPTSSAAPGLWRRPPAPIPFRI